MHALLRPAEGRAGARLRQGLPDRLDPVRRGRAGPPGAGLVVTAGRLLALGGAVTGGMLLIIELHTPQRFYNMLRIFRPTSPMSIGSFVLTGFGLLTAAALVAQMSGWGGLAAAAGMLGALLGLLMCVYPAALLAATSTPLWAAAPVLLAVRFAAASVASGGAMLCVLAIWPFANSRVAVAMAALAASALAIELTASVAARIVYAMRGVDGALRGREGALHLVAAQILGSALPLALYVASSLVWPETMMLLASGCALAGGFAMRGAILLAGNASAKRPEDYFRLASGAERSDARFGGGART
jgi:hypothetical protein